MKKINKSNVTVHICQSPIVMQLSSSFFLFCSLDQTSHPAQPPLAPRVPPRSPPGCLWALWPHACNCQSPPAAKESPDWRRDPWPWWRIGKETQLRQRSHRTPSCKVDILESLKETKNIYKIKCFLFKYWFTASQIFSKCVSSFNYAYLNKSEM